MLIWKFRHCLSGSVEHSVHWSQFCVEHSQSLYWFLPICGTLSTLVTVVCGTLTVSVLVPTCLWNTQYTGSEFCVEHSVYWFLPICGTLSTLVQSFVWNTHSQCTGSYLSVEHSVHWFSFVWNTHSQFTGSYLSVEH